MNKKTRNPHLCRKTSTTRKSLFSIAFHARPLKSQRADLGKGMIAMQILNSTKKHLVRQDIVEVIEVTTIEGVITMVGAIVEGATVVVKPEDSITSMVEGEVDTTDSMADFPVKEIISKAKGDVEVTLNVGSGLVVKVKGETGEIKIEYILIYEKMYTYHLLLNFVSNGHT